MSSFTITATYPSTEDGFVYADVLINDETEPRRLILPADPVDAQDKMAEYLGAPENQEQAPEPVATPLDSLVDKTIEV